MRLHHNQRGLVENEKRIFTLTLALLLCVGLATPAFAAEENVPIVWLPANISDIIGDFDGVFIVKDKSDRYGGIDIDGRVVIPFGEFDKTDIPSEGLASVNKDGKYGFINAERGCHSG